MSATTRCVRGLSCLGLILVMAGCAAIRPTAPTATEAKAVYATFLAKQQAKGTPAAAFSLTGSMSFAAHGKSGRLNYRFYGNLANPSRLDLATTMGGAYAALREDATEFTAYLPGKNTLFRHPDTRQGAAKLGMPLPFSLREMAALACGRFGELAPAKYASAKKVQDGYQYAFSGDPRLSALTLDFEGKPRHLTGRGVEPWQVDFTDDEPVPGLAAPVARKLTLTTPGGASLIIRIKSLQLRPEPYPAADLELPVPAQAATRSLDTPGDGPLLPDL
jgi:hypothetical protein